MDADAALGFGEVGGCGGLDRRIDGALRRPKGGVFDLLLLLQADCFEDERPQILRGRSLAQGTTGGQKLGAGKARDEATREIPWTTITHRTRYFHVNKLP